MPGLPDLRAIPSLLRPLFLPFRERRCPACLAPHSGPHKLCPACRPALKPMSSGFCPLCGEIHPAQSAAFLPPAPCAACIAAPPPWASFHFHSAHEGLLRQLLLAVKYRCDPAATQVLGLALAHICAPVFTLSEAPELLVPMPLHPLRLRTRGFNQCLELSRPLVRIHRMALGVNALSRVLAVRPQVGLHRAERLRNLERAFRAEPSLVRGRVVLLVDDTSTTGSSLRHASLALLEAGAARVHVAVLGRTRRHFRAVKA